MVLQCCCWRIFDFMNNICAIRMRSRIFIFFCVWCVINVQAANSNINLADGEEAESAGFVVTKESRRTLVSTENGEILAACSNDHLLHFFTMDPNSLFLPVLLHYDMVFYVHTGSGKLSWTEENELHTTDLRRGDVYRLKEGAVFFIQSNLETTERRKLRINAIFANSNTASASASASEPPTRPYSSIRDLVLGFDKKLLQAAFKVPEEEIDELFNGAKPPAIIHGVSKTQKFTGSLLRSRSSKLFQLKKKKGKGSVKLFNLFNEDKDFENRNGWSTAVTEKKLSVLKDTHIGLFMVNLTTGSMMGPHWNPMASEIAVVLQGHGMVHVVCSSVSNDTGCKNMRFEVEEGDVFLVPRFHPMAQMAFNNETFVFMGFSTSSENNHPQYLAGQASVLRTLSKQVLAMSFNVRNTTMDLLLASQQDSVILGCISCAEEEYSILEEEREKKREEERQRKEEEARKKEEEEAKRQEEEEEAEAKREEEEEEEAKREEQERKRHEEEEAEAKRQEQERKRHEEEEEEEMRRQEEEEEEAKREKEKRERQEEAAEKREAKEERTRQEEEMTRRKEEERERREEAAERREERRRREEEMARREEEERQRQEAEHKQRKEEREEKHGRRRSEEEEEEAEEEERRREQEEEREEGERERRHEEE